MLELSSLPDNINMLIGNFSLHSQKIEKYMALFDNFNMQIGTKYQLNNLLT